MNIHPILLVRDVNVRSYISSLKELDIKALQVLSAKVNVIPVIAKADTLTQDEMATFKKTVSMTNLIHAILSYLLYCLLIITIYIDIKRYRSQ